MTASDDRHHAYKPGGMLRCCILTIQELGEEDYPDLKAGDTLACTYCDAILTHDGEAWGWVPDAREAHR